MAQGHLVGRGQCRGHSPGLRARQCGSNHRAIPKAGEGQSRARKPARLGVTPLWDAVP